MGCEAGSPLGEALPLINVWGPQPVHSLSVVTKDLKFIYWGYSADGMTPTEELFHLSGDRFEMANLAEDSGYAAELAAMRANAVLVNIARGDVIDQGALVAALGKKQIEATLFAGGYAKGY